MNQADEVVTYPEYVPALIDEYRRLLDCLGPSPDDERIRELLIRHSEWSERGAAAVLRLAKTYGTFVLCNALALAEAMEIEDGDAGI